MILEEVIVRSKIMVVDEEEVEVMEVGREMEMDMDEEEL